MAVNETPCQIIDFKTLIKVTIHGLLCDWQSARLLWNGLETFNEFITVMSHESHDFSNYRQLDYFSKSFPQVSALIHRPVYNPIYRIFRRHWRDQIPMMHVLFQNLLCKQFINHSIWRWWVFRIYVMTLSCLTLYATYLWVCIWKFQIELVNLSLVRIDKEKEVHVCQIWNETMWTWLSIALMNPKQQQKFITIHKTKQQQKYIPSNM